MSDVRKTVKVKDIPNIISGKLCSQTHHVWVHPAVWSIAVLSHPLQKATLSQCVVALCSITGISVHVTLQVNICVITTYEHTSICS